MGYLSQKKQQKRENIVMAIMMAVVLVLTALYLFVPNFDWQYFNLFHLYCLSGILAIYALWRQKYKTLMFFTTFLIVNYIALAAYCNIFLSDGFDGRQSLELTFDPQQKLIDTLKDENVIASGTIIIANHYTAHYAVIRSLSPITLVEVDFRKAKGAEYPTIFRHLHEFILQNDNPVIIFGEFGIPAWSEPFKEFIDLSGLMVKNRLLFDNRFNIFSTPGFYVLGFKEMGIANISFTKSGKQQIINVAVSFNPEQL